MLGAFVIVLREGVEAALVVGIILASLGRARRTDLNRYVYGGLAAAVLASIALAAVVHSLALNAGNEVTEGIITAVAAVFVASMVAWLWRSGRRMKTATGARLGMVTRTGTAGAGMKRPQLALAGLAFLMVAREGAEVVLLLAAATVGRFDLLTVFGAAGGLAVAVLLGVLVVRGSVHVNLSRFFTITAGILALLALRMAVASVHEFAEAGLLHTTRPVEGFLEVFGGETFSVVLLAILVVALLVSMISGRHVKVRAKAAPTLPRPARR